MNSKTKSIILYTSLGILTAASVGAATYAVVKIIKDQQDNSHVIDDNEIWKNVPLQDKLFSQKNAFKICLKSEANIYTYGTAWTWYYKETGLNSFDWYLMTNFHVVNYPVAYANGLTKINPNSNTSEDLIVITDQQKLLNYYVSNIVTHFNLDSFDFSLSKFDFDKNKYRNIVSTNMGPEKPIIGVSNFNGPKVNSFEIITDFNNNSVDLFSKGNINNEYNSYNLDMALVKISFTGINKYNYEDYLCPNVWDIYSTNLNFQTPEGKKELEIKSNGSYKYIAGNPHSKEGKLVGYLFSNNERWTTKYEQLNTNNDEILNNLRAPYVYSNSSFYDFKLTGGSSGSSVYQLYDPETQDLNNLIPLAIYWGGRSITTNSTFKPSIIPFYVPGIYNVYDNFGKYINSNVV